MCVGTMSNKLRPTVGILDTGTRPSRIRTSFLPSKCLDCIQAIHNMFIKSASNRPVNVKGEVMLLGKRGNLQVHVHFAAVDNHAVLLLVRKSFTNSFVKGIFPRQRRIILGRSRTDTIISKYTPLQTC